MPTLTMEAALLTEVGVRANNEDAAYVSPRLVAVADGVGGAAAGEVASQLAINKIIGLEKRRLTRALHVELEATVADANDVIAFAAACDARHTGMATTLTAVALANDGTYIIANVGDSRTYLLRDRKLQQLSRDDSLVQELIDVGLLTTAEARQHPQRSIVLEALDGVERPLPRARSFEARAGDRLLLCSDGITDYLDDDAVGQLLAISDAAAALRSLVDSALAAGSRDNVTAVIADVVAGGPAADGWLDVFPHPTPRTDFGPPAA